jgi:membrane protein YqaA with SNARE-associated domain
VSAGAVYAALFGSAFLAATIFPAQSEAVLAALLFDGTHPATVLIAVASLGNVNWLLGRGIERFKDKSWFPARGNVLERAQGWYQRYGKWSLLLSWAPFVGDPLTVVAGVMREPFLVFLALVTVAKVGRYLVLAAVVT